MYHINYVNSQQSAVPKAFDMTFPVAERYNDLLALLLNILSYTSYTFEILRIKIKVKAFSYYVPA